MDILNYHQLNLKPVSAVYTPDPDIKLRDYQEFTKDSLDFTFVDILSSLQDTSINNYTNLYLSEKKKTSQVLTGKTPKTTYPVYRTTYLKLSGLDNFLTVTNSTVTTGASANADNSYYFELEILDATYLAVRHYSGTDLRYLTLSASGEGDVIGDMSFKPRELSATGGTVLAPFFTYGTSSTFLPGHDIQIFEYVLDDTNNTLSLLKSTLTGGGWDIDNSVPIGKLVYPGAVTWVTGNTLSSVALSEQDNIYHAYNTFDIQPVVLSPSNLNLQTTWNSYTSAIEDNTLNVDTNSSLQDIQNGILIHSATNSISSNMGINLIPLKNQITVDGYQSRCNPYSNIETEIHHRDYHHLHTGSHEEMGTDHIYLDYTSGVKRVTFPPNELTYFHIPNIFTPYRQLNINDAKLPKLGAICADVPVKADKVFKKRQVSGNLTDVLDETEGTLLCSWLSGNSNTDITPVWVDRYYNPSFITYTQALTSGQVIGTLYQDKFTSVTTKLSAQNIHIYDKISDLIFEPGALYAYYHVGNHDSNQIISSLSDNVIAKDLTVYKAHDYTNAIPTHEAHGKDTHVMDNGSVMTGTVHDANSIYVPPTYSFYRDNYGVSDILSRTGSFTLAFWMHNDAWETPFADQLLGTYVTNGFGIFNEPFVTPFIAIPNGDKVHVFNSEYKHIDVHLNNKPIKHITKRGSTENYWFIDSNNDIYEYDIKGAIQNKISTSNLPVDADTSDIDINDTHLYVAVLTSAQAGNYFKYDLRTQTPGDPGELLTANVWNSGADTNNNTLKIHSVKTGLSAAAGVILTAPDKGLTQGSVIDNLGNPWVIQNNYLCTYDTSTTTNISGVSAAGTQSLEAVNCDKDNNIWLLYGGTKVVKLDTNRNTLFTLSLTGTPYQSTRYIDFVYEFNKTGYDGYATVLNQSVSGARVININLDGTVRSESPVLTGTESTTYITRFETSPVSASWKSTTGFDYLRSNKLNPAPRIEAKLALTNLYNSSTTTAAYSAYTLSYELSGMKRGWHHIGVIFDAERGNYELLIDTVSVNKVTLPPAKFSFSKIFTQPLVVGTTPFYTNIPLPEHLSQPTHYLANNTKIKRLTVYDKALSYFDLRAHYLIDNKIETVSWDIPTGQRNYIDTVERTFKHRLPGRISDLFNINIRGLSASDIAFKQAIQAKILEELNDDIPIYTRLNNILWDSNSVAVSSVSANNVSMAVGVTSPTSISSTTQVGQGTGGGGYTY